MSNETMLLDWNDSIENDGTDFIILEDGDYNFTVTEFERGRFPGSAKTPACNKATLTLTVETSDGKAVVKVDLILHRNMEWHISSFFRCIGQKKHGERLEMNWNKVIGAKGRARFSPRSYIAKDGTERQTNDVGHFYDYDPSFFSDGWVHEAEQATQVQTDWTQEKF